MKQNYQFHEDDMGYQDPGGLPDLKMSDTAPEIAVAPLTRGGDRPYAFGLAMELISKGATLDVIGSDDHP
jgi:hypothetical protein